MWLHVHVKTCTIILIWKVYWLMLFYYCSEYIDPNANNMVNLSANAFEEAQKDVANPSRYSFSLAQVHTSCSLISIYYKWV